MHDGVVRGRAASCVESMASMTRRTAALPRISLPEEFVWTGDLPSALARLSLAHGPIFTWSQAPDVVRSIAPVLAARRDAVVMVGPEAARFVLHTHRDHFSNHQGWAPIFGDAFGNGLMLMDLPEHRLHRKLWSTAFTHAALDGYLPVIRAVYDDRLRRWGRNDALDLVGELRALLFDAVAVALAGIPRGEAVARIRALMLQALYGPLPEAVLGGPRPRRTLAARVARRARRTRALWMYALAAWLETRTDVQISAHARLDRRLRAHIAARRALGGTETAHTVLDTLIQARGEDGCALDDAQVLDHLKLLLVAGSETTSAVAAWVLYLLSVLPEQQRVREEIGALTPHDAAAPTIATLERLTVLDAFIREVGRLYAPVIDAPRVALRDFTFAGYSVPAGSRVLLALGATHRLPALFADPESFNSDRFAAPRDEDRRHGYALVTFGSGPRICIGHNLAGLMIKLLVMRVLHSSELLPIYGQQPVHTGLWHALIRPGLLTRVRPRG